jgi:hypothetical protein
MIVILDDAIGDENLMKNVDRGPFTHWSEKEKRP